MGIGASLLEIQQVYEQSFSAFVRTAAAICGGRECGRDAVHDAFVSAVRGRRRFRRDGPVEAWLWRAVVHAALKQRANRREELGDGFLTERTPANSNGHAGELAEVRAAIAHLPERQRLIVFLRYYADLEYQQIADALGIRRGTVGAALHAAHQSLRGSLEEVVDHE